MRQIERASMSPESARARAFNQGFDVLNQGIADAVGGYATERQRAFDRAMNLREQGYDVTPDQVFEATRPFGVEPTSFTDLFNQRTQEYQDQAYQARLRDQAKTERENEQAKLDKEYKREQIANLRRSRGGGQTSQGGAMVADNQAQPQAMPKMGAEEKKTIGGIAEGFRSINEMEAALNQGVGPEYLSPNTPVIGSFFSDTPFTKAQRVLTDVVGRLQSGGAINKDEEERFLNMGPRPGDSRDIQIQKIQDQRNFLANKLRAYGMDEKSMASMGFNIAGSPAVKETAAPSGFQSIPQQVPFAPMQEPSLIGDAQASDPMSAVKNMTREQKLKFLGL